MPPPKWNLIATRELPVQAIAVLDRRSGYATAAEFADSGTEDSPDVPDLWDRYDWLQMRAKILCIAKLRHLLRKSARLSSCDQICILEPHRLPRPSANLEAE